MPHPNYTVEEIVRRGEEVYERSICQQVNTDEHIGKIVSIDIESGDNTELVPASDPRSTFISIDPNRLWGTACIAGSRVPIKSLFDHLIDGVSLDAFLDDFDGVPREKCIKAIATAFERLMEGLPNGRAER